MTEYIINYLKKTCSYLPDIDIIRIATGNLDMLTDSELIEYISDCLTHENTHKVLYRLFDNNVSKLFDGIEYLFRNDKLHEKILSYENGLPRVTYQSYIKKYGFEKFLDHYHLNKQDITDANILCNTRKSTHDWVEIFGVPRHREIENIEPEDIIRIYPNHVIIRIDVV